MSSPGQQQKRLKTSRDGSFVTTDDSKKATQRTTPSRIKKEKQEEEEAEITRQFFREGTPQDAIEVEEESKTISKEEFEEILKDFSEASLKEFTRKIKQKKGETTATIATADTTTADTATADTAKATLADTVTLADTAKATLADTAAPTPATAAATTTSSALPTSSSSFLFPLFPFNDNEFLKISPLIFKAYKRAGINPRKQQWETVSEILKDIMWNQSCRSVGISSLAEEENKKNYLIQHSVGSGKSYTIACLVLFLDILKSYQSSQPYFQRIVILNDRKALHFQLSEIIIDFLKMHGRPREEISVIRSTSQLKSILMNDKARIIVTTIQKFTKILFGDEKQDNKKTIEVEDDAAEDEMEVEEEDCAPTEGDEVLKILPKMAKIAIIADEAHRSHGKQTTRKLHSFLGGNSQQSSNITYFSFTSTPTVKALEMFGELREGLYQPFYTYSIEESLRDGYILDVLKNYTCVSIDVQIQSTPKTIEAKEEMGECSTSEDQSGQKVFKSGPAVRKVMREAHNSPELIKLKAEHIVSHFLGVVEEFATNPSTFTPKSMVVTSSRKAVMLYTQSISKFIATLPLDQRFEVVGAFTAFYDNGKLITENDLETNKNHIKSKGDIISAFKDPKSKVKMIICADKFQTGFDEPMLHTMYIDKCLRNANAVQTIGRLNRIATGKGGTCVIDFVNTKNDIERAYAKYWRTTVIKAGQLGPRKKQKMIELQTALANRLLNIPFIKQKDLQKAVNYFLLLDYIDASLENNGDNNDEASIEAARRNKVSRCLQLEKDIKRYLVTCDQLQNEHPSLPSTFLCAVQNELYWRRSDMTNSWFDDLIKEIQVVIGKMKELAFRDNQKISSTLVTALWSQELLYVIDNTNPELEMTLSEIVEAVNEEFRRKISEMQGFEALTSSLVEGRDYDANTPTVQVAALSEDTLPFAKEIWKVNETVAPPVKKQQQIRTLPVADTNSLPKEKKKQLIEEEEALITAFARTVSEQATMGRQEYEMAIRHASNNDPKFGFLDPEHPNHPYYEWKLSLIAESQTLPLPGLAPPPLHVTGSLGFPIKPTTPLRTKWNSNTSTSSTEPCTDNSTARTKGKPTASRPVFRPTVGKKC